MDNWFIKIHKKILEWEWYDDINTTRLFIHLLLKANWEDNKWHWIEIKRWELLTWRLILSKETWLSEQQCRTSISKLKSTNEITSKTTNRYSIIKLLNYDKYQTKQPTKQHTSNQQITTTKEYKDNKDNKDNISKDIEQSSKIIYWNSEINEMQELIKNTITELWLIYKTGKYERNHIKNILTWREFWKICETAKMPRQEFVKNIITLSTKLEFRKGKINNAETFYKHYDKVYNEAVNLKTKINKIKNNYTLAPNNF